MLAVALWFVAGAVAPWAVPRSRDAAPLLQSWVVNVALPCLVLARLPALEWSGAAAVPVMTAWGVLAAGAVSVSVLARRLGWSASVTGTMLLLVPLGNTSFLGVPVTESLLGPDCVPAALAFDQLGTFLALATYGTWVAARHGSAGSGAPTVARRVVTFPPFVALVVSIALRRWPPGPFIADVLSTAGRSVAPVAMLATGLRMSLPRPRTASGPVVIGLVLKMVVLPLAVAAVMTVAGDPASPVWQASLLESAMPPMVTAGIVAARAGLDENLAGAMVAVGTVAALVVATVVSFVV